MANVESTPAKTVTSEKVVKNLSQLLTQVRADGKLKQRLVATPLAVLQEHGIEVPAGVEVRVVENTDKVSYLTLPSTTQMGELTTDELGQVSGGNPIAAAVAIFAAGYFGGKLADGIDGKLGVSKDAIQLAKDYASKKPQ